jgi:predicted PhzF superfamily epimerase YddE/YHI9
VKYAFHIVDVFSSTPFGGNQLAVLPDAAGISTEGMQQIAREFNFGETTFVLPTNDSANTFRVRIFTPRVELDFAGHPSVGTACALVMKQHVRLSDPVRLVLEENAGPFWRDGLSSFDPAGVSIGRRSDIVAEARKSGSVVTSVGVGGAAANIASGEIDVPPSALKEDKCL